MPSQLRDWPLHISSPICTWSWLTPCSTVRDQRVLTMPDSQIEKRWHFMLPTLISILIQKQYSPDFSARRRCSLRIPNKLPYLMHWGMEAGGSRLCFKGLTRRSKSVLRALVHTTPHHNGKERVDLDCSFQYRGQSLNELLLHCCR